MAYNKITNYLRLFYNSIINRYFISLIEMALKLIIDREYLKISKNINVLVVDFDKLINDLSLIVKEVNEIKENITINVNRKHLLIKL